MRCTSFLATLLVAALPTLVCAQQLTVSAAASLRNAFSELAPKFEAARFTVPGVARMTITLN